MSIGGRSSELPGDHLSRSGLVDCQSTSASALLVIAYFPNGQTCAGSKYDTRTTAIVAQFTCGAQSASALDPGRHSPSRNRRKEGDVDLALKCVLFRMLLDFYTCILSDAKTKVSYKRFSLYLMYTLYNNSTMIESRNIRDLIDLLFCALKEQLVRFVSKILHC